MGVDGLTGWFSRRVPPAGSPLLCAECGRMSDERARGWRGYRSDVEHLVDLPALEFSCPTCSEPEPDG